MTDDFYRAIYNDGLKEGRLEGVETVAINMIAGGLPLEQIALFSGLPLAEVGKLKGRSSVCRSQRCRTISTGRS